MDQIKIGKFIAERRKDEGLTQLELADKLHVTDRAVSKWETGKSLPDSSIMLELCEILKISVTELLNGERIEMENYNKKTDEELLDLVKQKNRADKMLLRLECVIGILSIIVLLVPVLIGSFIPKGAIADWQRAVIILSGVIPCIVGLLFALKIEQVAGYYECRICKHKYVPTYKAVNLAMHMGRTRYMKCPKCGKKSWQKKVVSKD